MAFLSSAVPATNVQDPNQLQCHSRRSTQRRTPLGGRELNVGCDYDKNVPFRPLLIFIVECLHENGFATELTLPDYDDFEDFIDGTMLIQFEDSIEGTQQVQSFRIFVYFEYSLSYLSLSAEHEIGLRIVEACTSDKVFLHEGYGLTDGVSG